VQIKVEIFFNDIFIDNQSLSTEKLRIYCALFALLVVCFNELAFYHKGHKEHTKQAQRKAFYKYIKWSCGYVANSKVKIKKLKPLCYNMGHGGCVNELLKNIF
jgi:hypothetical protein